jgi:putative endonuclease
MYYVYVLKLKNNDLYIGYTNSIKKRLEDHQRGKSKFTKPQRPVKLVYYEAYLSKEDATKRESHLKTSQQRELLKKRIENSIKN